MMPRHSPISALNLWLKNRAVTRVFPLMSYEKKWDTFLFKQYNYKIMLALRAQAVLILIAHIVSSTHRNGKQRLHTRKKEKIS